MLECSVEADEIDQVYNIRDVEGGETKLGEAYAGELVVKKRKDANLLVDIALENCSVNECDEQRDKYGCRVILYREGTVQILADR